MGEQKLRNSLLFIGYVLLISFIYQKIGLLGYFSANIGFILWIAFIIIPIVIVIITLPKHSIMKLELIELIGGIAFVLIFIGIPIFIGYQIGYFQFWENILIKIFGEGVEEYDTERIGFIIGWILFALATPLLFPKFVSYFPNKPPISKKTPIKNSIQYDKVIDVPKIDHSGDFKDSETQEKINKAPDFRLLSTALAFCLINYYYNDEIFGWEGVISAVIVGVIYTAFTIGNPLNFSKDASKKKLIDHSASISNLSETTDIPDQIKKLSELKDRGILSKEEFQTKKKELLDRI